MGFRVNREPFSMLARQVPFNVVRKLAGNRLQTEALFFGQAGLLPPNSMDPYVIELIREYDHLSRMYGLRRMDPGLWKFMRMRPNNFPTIRISQFARLTGRIDQVVDHILQRNSIEDLYKMLQVRASVYWNDHYTFDVMSPGKPKVIGKRSIENILINTVAIFSFWYGRSIGELAAVDHSMEILNSCTPESNRFIRQWIDAGMDVTDAAGSQALYHLITSYCSQKKCLNCAWSAGSLHK
jgi:hypothetical protein